MTARLDARLKTETRALHTAAERSRLMRVLLQGRLPVGGYVALLRNLHAVYAALEPALARHAGHPLIAPLPLARLWRLPALAHDLLALHGPGWADEIALQPAAARYVQRLQEIERSAPQRLLAHAYVRYLGDLSGGQVLGRIVAQSIAGPGRSATAFYAFGTADDTVAVTRAVRQGLAGLAPEEADAEAIVDEARRAFMLHADLFDELADACGLPDTAAALR